MKVGIRQGVCYDSPAECESPENGWRSSVLPIPGCGGRKEMMPPQVGGRGGRVKVCAVRRHGTAPSADLGGSSKYSNENFED